MYGDGGFDLTRKGGGERSVFRFWGRGLGLFVSFTFFSVSLVLPPLTPRAGAGGGGDSFSCHGVLCFSAIHGELFMSPLFWVFLPGWKLFARRPRKSVFFVFIELLGFG